MSEVSIAFYTEALKIDKNNLDEMLIMQPSLYQQVTELLAYAIAERDTIKAQLKEYEAKESIRIVDSAGGKKPSDVVIKNMVIATETFTELTADYIKAEQKVNTFTGLCDSFNQRSYLLRDLTTRSNSENYMTPYVKEEKPVYTSEEVSTRRRKRV